MKKVLRIIDYNFQRREQLTEAYDDSNSMRYISKDFDITVIGRLDIKTSEFHIVEDEEGGKYNVTFLPSRWQPGGVLEYISALGRFDVIHMHGTSAWPQYFTYADYFRAYYPNTKMIFSPAGGCKGPPRLLNQFDHIIVNHPMQIERMRCDQSKVVVRKRSADPRMFRFIEKDFEYDFIYVAGFTPLKQIDLMIDYVLSTSYTLVVLGDFSRIAKHYQFIVKCVDKYDVKGQIFLKNFITQAAMVEFLGKCRMWVWPNIPSENPGTTTNRSVIEALACGKPLLVGEQAFNQTEYLVNGFNGYKYSNKVQFAEKASLIMTSPKTYRNNSLKLNNDHFSFQRNFVGFYKNLYGSM